MVTVRSKVWAVLLPIAAVALDTVLFSPLGNDDNVGTLVVIQDPGPALVLIAAIPMIPALCWRKRWPTVMCLGLAAYSIALTVVIGSRPLVTLLFALYTAAMLASFARSGICLAANLAAHGVTVAYETASESNVATVVAVGTVFSLFNAAAWFFGLRASFSAARERQLVLEQERLATESVAKERLTIARELHDIVANAVTVVVLQAAGARPLVRTSPQLVESALGTIEEVANGAMTELRQLLTVLRAVSDTVEISTGPALGLSDIESLQGRMQNAKIGVSVSIQPDLGRLLPSQELTAYRIVQESLTNVTRYAGEGCHAKVTLERQADDLVVTVVNDSAGTAQPRVRTLSTGFGLAGLRERVTLLGGELESGPVPGGGWQVQAKLPLPPEELGRARNPAGSLNGSADSALSTSKAGRS